MDNRITPITQNDRSHKRKNLRFCDLTGGAYGKLQAGTLGFRHDCLDHFPSQLNFTALLIRKGV
jgi:hypothetical protein